VVVTVETQQERRTGIVVAAAEAVPAAYEAPPQRRRVTTKATSAALKWPLKWRAQGAPFLDIGKFSRPERDGGSACVNRGRSIEGRARLTRSAVRALVIKVHWVSTASEAKALLDERTYDLVLTDLMLPDGNGLDRRGT
jgi:hypothetical protein